MGDEQINRLLVVLFVASVFVYPIAIPLWLLATLATFVWSGLDE